MSEADAYEDNLRKRLKEARALIAAHEGKKVGPYVVTAELCAATWGDVARLALQFLKAVEKGPERLYSSGGGAGTRFTFIVKSGDQIPKDHVFLRSGHAE